MTFIPGGKLHTPGGIAGLNSGTISGDVFWAKDTSGAVGVGSGKAMQAKNGLSNAQLVDPASYGLTWDFSSKGVWQL